MRSGPGGVDWRGSGSLGEQMGAKLRGRSNCGVVRHAIATWTLQRRDPSLAQSGDAGRIIVVVAAPSLFLALGFARGCGMWDVERRVAMARAW